MNLVGIILYLITNTQKDQKATLVFKIKSLIKLTISLILACSILKTKFC